MKKINILFALLMLVGQVFAQSLSGTWNGALKIQNSSLRVVFNIKQTDNGYISTMDSPDQGAKDIPVTSTGFQSPNLKLEIKNAGIEYNGILKGDEIIGIFKQGNQEFPMNLSRGQSEKKVLIRPQEPTKPYGYNSEDITFENKVANISLAGTFTYPSKGDNFPVVILISGSGPQNRDEEILGHKPFLVLSDHLTKNGIAVLRFDDRGVGKSTGKFKDATTADFATDVESAITYLKTRKEIDPKKIGLMGHSEGGIIAPMVAARSKEVDFIVLLAGTGLRGDKILLLQQELIARASGVSEVEIAKSRRINSEAFDIVLKSNESESLKNDLRVYLANILKNEPSASKPTNMSNDDFIEAQVKQISGAWMQYFIKYDPSLALQEVKCPVLAINGAKDLQVPPKEDLAAIEKALKKGGNKYVTIKEMPNLNHLFQECKTGSLSEYASIEQTFSPLALSEITNWVKVNTGIN